MKNAYQVRVTDETGQGIANVGLCLTNNDPTQSSSPNACWPPLHPGTYCDGNPLSDASGLIVCDLRIGAVAGVVNIFPVVGGLTALQAITINTMLAPTVDSLAPAASAGK